HYVIEGMKEKARNRKGQVTWNDLVEYVTGKVEDEVPVLIGGGAKQTPHEIRSFAGRSPVLLPAGKEEVVKKKQAKTITNSIGMKLVLIPGGKFTMGSPKGEEDRSEDEKQHAVEITKAFYLGMHEVTQKQYRAVMGKNPSWFSSDGEGKDKVKGLDTDDFPVE